MTCWHFWDEDQRIREWTPWVVRSTHTWNTSPFSHSRRPLPTFVPFDWQKSWRWLDGVVGHTDTVPGRCRGQLKVASLLETRVTETSRGRWEYLLFLTLEVFSKTWVKRCQVGLSHNANDGDQSRNKPLNSSVWLQWRGVANLGSTVFYLKTNGSVQTSEPKVDSTKYKSSWCVDWFKDQMSRPLWHDGSSTKFVSMWM